jgi:hypothetical protein
MFWRKHQIQHITVQGRKCNGMIDLLTMKVLCWFGIKNRCASAEKTVSMLKTNTNLR